MSKELKLPMQAVLNASLDLIRLSADCTDAVVIIINQKTGDAKVGSLRGDIKHTAEILARTLQSVQKSRMGSGLSSGGLIISG